MKIKLDLLIKRLVTVTVTVTVTVSDYSLVIDELMR